MAEPQPTEPKLTTDAEPLAKEEPRKRAVRGVRNPGFYDDCMAEYKRVAAFDCFSGGRLNFSYPVKKGTKVLTTHLNMDMDASLNDRYTVNTGVALGTKADATQLSASLTNAWGTMGAFSHRFNPKYSLKSDFQFTRRGDMLNLELQRKGVDCCHSAKYSSTPEGHKFSASCMQSLTRFASIGGRLDCGPAGNVLLGSGRYKRMFKGPEGEKGHHGTTTTIFANSEGAMGATFTQQLDLHTHLGAEILVQNSEVTASAASLLTYQTFDLQAKVSPASGLVSCFVEHKFNPGVSTLFSGQYNQWTGESRFGLGLKVGL